MKPVLDDHNIFSRIFSLVSFLKNTWKRKYDVEDTGEVNNIT